jgi:hypothetical protein
MTNDARLRWIILLGAPVAFGIWSLLLGQDANWDLRNYHWYNPYALVTGRAAIDGAPAGLQTWLAPFIELVWFGLAQMLPAPAVGFIIGAVQSANFVLLFLLGAMLLPIEGALERHAVAFLVAVAGVCGAGTVTQIGTTTNDATVSIGVLGSLWLVFRSWRTLLGGPRGQALVQVAIAGFPIGLALAAKLTMVPFAIGLLAGFLAIPRSVARRVSLIGGFAAGIAVPTAILAVPWLIHVWRQTGNPIFPYLNSLFRSPLVDVALWWQYHGQPADIAEALTFPLRFIGLGHSVMELPFRDFRILAAYVLVPLLLIATACLRSRPASEPRGDVYLYAAMAVSYVGWVVLFSHYRFVLPLEMLSPLMIALAIARLPVNRWAMRVAVSLIMVALLATSQAADYGHVPWRSRFVEVSVPPLARPDASMVLLLDQPMAYVVPSFPAAVRFLQLWPNFAASDDPTLPWHRLMQQRIDAHRGDLFAIREKRADPAASRARLAGYGLTLVEAGCRPMATNLAKWPDEMLIFCPVMRSAEAGAVTPP